MYNKFAIPKSNRSAAENGQLFINPEIDDVNHVALCVKTSSGYNKLAIRGEDTYDLIDKSTIINLLNHYLKFHELSFLTFSPLYLLGADGTVTNFPDKTQGYDPELSFIECVNTDTLKYMSSLVPEDLIDYDLYDKSQNKIQLTDNNQSVIVSYRYLAVDGTFYTGRVNLYLQHSYDKVNIPVSRDINLCLVAYTASDNTKWVKILTPQGGSVVITELQTRTIRVNDRKENVLVTEKYQSLILIDDEQPIILQ